MFNEVFYKLLYSKRKKTMCWNLHILLWTICGHQCSAHGTQLIFTVHRDIEAHASLSVICQFLRWDL